MKIKEHTVKDEVLQKVHHAIETGNWNEKEDDLQPYIQCAEECIVKKNQDVILKGSRIVVPSSLQKKTTELGHSGHQGIEKTKALSEGKDLVSQNG